MSGQQKAVLWIGLILIILNASLQWVAIRSVLFKPKSTGSGAGGIPNILPFALPYLMTIKGQTPQPTPSHTVVNA